MGTTWLTDGNSFYSDIYESESIHKFIILLHWAGHWTYFDVHFGVWAMTKSHKLLYFNTVAARCSPITLFDRYKFGSLAGSPICFCS